MNIDQIILEHKCKKIGNPISAVKIADIPLDVFQSFKDSIYERYDLEDKKYSTKEFVFQDTLRIVGKTPYMMTSEQKYTSLDFDYELLELVQPIINEVRKYLPNSKPSIIQLATLLPGQKLKWHVDSYLYQQFSNKLHIPLQTNKDATYEIFLEDRTYKKDNMSAGAIWNINNLVLHRSVNTGVTSRTHLIIDFIDEHVLDILKETKINYYHYNLPSMIDYSNKVTSILVEELKKYSK